MTTHYSPKMEIIKDYIVDWNKFRNTQSLRWLLTSLSSSEYRDYFYNEQSRTSLRKYCEEIQRAVPKDEMVRQLIESLIALIDFYDKNAMEVDELV